MSCQKFIGIFANISACLNLPIFAVSHSWEGALICSAIAMAVSNVIGISGMLTECFEWNGVDPVADRLWFFFFFEGVSAIKTPILKISACLFRP